MIYPYCGKGGSCKGITFLLHVVTKYDVNVAIKIVE